MWPGPEARARQKLPRVEDLPVAERGYDQQQVREAFDAFYRHIAQLDTTLRALEAVEAFRQQAGELRKELRALKAAGWTQQPWPAYSSARVSPGLPESLPRFAIEAAFLILVAVVVAVAGFNRLSIVLVMALAWAIVGVVEWAASRERFARRTIGRPVRARPEPAPPAPLRVVSAAPAAQAAWADPALAPEEELTVIRPGEETAGDVEPAGDPPIAEEPQTQHTPELEPAPEAADEVEPAVERKPELEPELQPSAWSWAADAAVERARERDGAAEPASPRRRFWQRRSQEPNGLRFDPAQPRHVRVLQPEPPFDEQFPVDRRSERVDPWEEELDLSIEDSEAEVPVDVDAASSREPAFAEAPGERETRHRD